MKKSKEGGEPFFVWLNTSRMHLYTRIGDDWLRKVETITSETDYHGAGMLQHDHDVGLVLDWLDENGLAENTIVVYSTDNGPEHSSWPHGATTPFRGEKMTTYEGGVRVPMMARWPGKIPAGSKLNGIQGHQDTFTTLATATGVPDVAERIMAEKKQVIDGVNNLDYWMGKSEQSNRNHIFTLLREQADRGAYGAMEVPLLYQGGLLRECDSAHRSLGFQHSHGSLREL
jgi:arylsulfatase